MGCLRRGQRNYATPATLVHRLARSVCDAHGPLGRAANVYSLLSNRWRSLMLMPSSADVFCCCESCYLSAAKGVIASDSVFPCESCNRHVAATASVLGILIPTRLKRSWTARV